MSTETVTILKADLDILVAACTSYFPPDVHPDVHEAFGRVLAAFDEAHGIAQEEATAVSAGGQFMFIAFMGRIEYTGYVTEITKNGQPAYRIDLPEKIWGGNPLAYVEHAASAWFSDRPVTEESVRRAWDAEVRAAEKRRQQEAEWRRTDERRARERRALAAADPLAAAIADDDLDDEDADEDDPDDEAYDEAPGWPH